MSWRQRSCITSSRSHEFRLIFFFLTKADKLLHPLSRIHGAKGETWVCGLPGPERSGDGVRHRSHGDASEFRNNSCEAARLLCQRVASQAGKIGACKLSVVELWKPPQMKCWVGKKINMLLKYLHDTFKKTGPTFQNMPTGLPPSFAPYNPIAKSVLLHSHGLTSGNNKYHQQPCRQNSRYCHA